MMFRFMTSEVLQSTQQIVNCRLIRSTWKPLGKNSTVPVRHLNKLISKKAFKNHIHNMLLSIVEDEHDYVEGPILLKKIANYVA